MLLQNLHPSPQQSHFFTKVIPTRVYIVTREAYTVCKLCYLFPNYLQISKFKSASRSERVLIPPPPPPLIRRVKLAPFSYTRTPHGSTHLNVIFFSDIHYFQCVYIFLKSRLYHLGIYGDPPNIKSCNICIHI